MKNTDSIWCPFVSMGRHHHIPGSWFVRNEDITGYFLRQTLIINLFGINKLKLHQLRIKLFLTLILASPAFGARGHMSPPAPPLATPL